MGQIRKHVGVLGFLALCIVLAGTTTRDLGCAAAAFAQDPLRAEQYKALRGLSEITSLVHRPDESQTVATLIGTLGLDSKALGDVIRVSLSKNIPKLRLSDTFRNDRPYLEVHWYGNATALSLSLSLWRWTRIEATNESVFATVWDTGTLIVHPDRQTVRDQLDDFLTSFASDYLRANPPTERR